MKTRLVLILCIFAISAKGIAAQETTLYSSSATARTFSRCVVDKMCQSQVFNSDEQSSMVGVADVMAQGLKSLESGNKGPVSVRILLKAFVTSLADIVTHGEDSRTSIRQNAYSTAVEQCSLSTIDRVDIETVSDSLRILYSLEDSQILRLREEIAPLGFSETDMIPPRININPLPPVLPGFPRVNPSPVQSPSLPTKFGQFPDTAFMPPGSLFNIPLSPLPADSTLVGPPPLRFPSFGSSSSFSQDGSGASSILPGQIKDYSSLVDSHIAPSFGFGAFNLPQTEKSPAYAPRASQFDMIAPFQSPHAPQNFFNQYPVQPGVNMGSPLSYDESRLRDPSGPTFMGIIRNTDQLSQTGQFDYTPHQIGGLSVPQVKESSVRVIPPLVHAQPTDDAISQDKSLPVNLHLPSTSENPLPQNLNIFVTTSPASIPNIDKEKQNFPKDSILESIVSEILKNSTSFREAFDFGIDPQNALSLAQILTEQSLTGYNTDMVREALNAVSDAVARVTVSSPENYAAALSDALVHVLKTHNLPLFVDGSKVATSMLSNLDALMQIPPEYTTEQSGEFISTEDYFGQETQSPFDSQFPATTLEYNNENVFSKALAQYILKSDELAGFFCQKNFPPNRMKIYFSLIKNSLTDLGPQVSSIVASVTSGNLLHLPDEVLCSSYAQTISVTIADILHESDMLSQVKAESIANKMVISLRQELGIPTQEPEKNYSSTSQTSKSLPPITTPIIQTSFTNSFDSSYQETSALPDIYAHSSTHLMTSSEATTYKTDDVSSAIEITTEKAASALSITTSIPIQKPSTEAMIQSHTSSFTSDIDDAQLASATAFMYSLIPSPTTETSSTAEDRIPSISGDKIDKEKLSSFLSKEMESVVDAISDENVQEEKSSDEVPTTESEDIGKNDDSQSTQKPQLEDISDFDTTPTPDVHVVKVRSSRHHSGSSQPIENSDTTDHTSSEISSTQFPLDLKKSGFQKSQFSNKTSAAMEKLAHKSDLLVSRYDDSKYIYAMTISQLAANSIAFLKSQNFNLSQLCSKLNLLAPIFDIPPLYHCEEYAVIDYLLHVLQSMPRLFKDD